MSNIKQNLINLMAEKEIAAYGLSKKANLKIATVQNILYGKSKSPTIGVLSAIAKALDCTIADLIDEEAVTRDFPELEWNPSLFFSIMNYMSAVLLERKAKIPYKKALQLIKECYEYCQHNKLDTVDRKFSDWLIEKNIK